MKVSRYLLIAASLLLAACSDHRPVYSGHEESTEGVPGFVNGKKQSPYVKLGQSYTVDGEEYVPHNQQDYVEEGMASWYGPGFHGGKTANGETFNANELTGAHRTLPLPSIVRVTMLSNGKQVFIRINDRGPFAHSRILDMSRAAADKIGLLRAGVAKVRIEYMPKESQRFADLLAQGRDPKSIDLASDVVGYSGEESSYAQADIRGNSAAPSTESHSGSFWDNFGSSPANASEPTPEAAIEALKTPIPTETNGSAPVSDVVSHDLAAPAAAPKAAPVYKVAAVTPNRAAAAQAPAQQPAAPTDDPGNSPFAMLDSGAGEDVDTPIETGSIPTVHASAPVTSAPAGSGGTFVQLGAFSNQANAERLMTQYKGIAPLQIVQKTNADGHTLFHVRSGPYSTADASAATRDKLTAAGADAHLVRE